MRRGPVFEGKTILDFRPLNADNQISFDRAEWMETFMGAVGATPSNAEY